MWDRWRATVVTVSAQKDEIMNGSFVRVDLNAVGESLPFTFGFQYDSDLNSWLNAQRFVFGMRLHEHDFYLLDRNTIVLTVPGA